METINQKTWIVGIVGPCGSGKSTLISALHRETIQFRHIAQEHSYIPSMWQQLTNPDVLIFLDASYKITCQRGQLNWTEAEYAEQHRRLAHARQYADYYILTDDLTPDEVQLKVNIFLEQKGILNSTIDS
jgi:ABC-type cobalamin/Fe3+-siderophores transport system ATPase subunit